jgi:hypothetical protein
MGRHYDDLAIADSENYEATVLGILKDLIDEDPFQLTLSELYHIFTLVKVISVGPTLDVNVRCNHVVESTNEAGKIVVRECGASNTAKYSLLDSDVKRAPSDYKVPEVTFKYRNQERVYLVRPPTMTQELALYHYFAEKGISRKVLSDASNKKATYAYGKHRLLLHLHDKESGDTFVDQDRREEAVEAMATENPVSFMKSLSSIVDEENGFGILSAEKIIVCKECGGKLNYRLPLSAGLAL